KTGRESCPFSVSCCRSDLVRLCVFLLLTAYCLRPTAYCLKASASTALPRSIHSVPHPSCYERSCRVRLTARGSCRGPLSVPACCSAPPPGRKRRWFAQ